MPTYLCHGFRWHRRHIRIFIIIHNLDDAAPGWIMGPVTSELILDQFRENFDFLPKPPYHPPRSPPLPPPSPPKPMTAWEHEDDFSLPPLRQLPPEQDIFAYQDSPVKLLEEYDLEGTAPASRHYAWIADWVSRVDLSVDIVGEMAKYDERRAREEGGSWFEKLRDKLEPGTTDMGWYVVVCDDVERAAPDVSGESSGEDESVDEGPPTPVQEKPSQSTTGNTTTTSSDAGIQSLQEDSSDYSAQSGSETNSAEAKGSQTQKRTSRRSLRSKPSLALRRLFGKKDADAK